MIEQKVLLTSSPESGNVSVSPTQTSTRGDHDYEEEIKTRLGDPEMGQAEVIELPRLVN